jgi:hypothetical protein
MGTVLVHRLWTFGSTQYGVFSCGHDSGQADNRIVTTWTQVFQITRIIDAIPGEIDAKIPVIEAIPAIIDAISEITGGSQTKNSLSKGYLP